MMTQSANMANIVTTIHGGRSARKTEATLVDSFQSYVAAGNSGLAVAQSKRSEGYQNVSGSDTSHQDMYAKEKLSTDSYGKDIKSDSSQTITNVNADDRSNSKLPEEQMQELEEDIRSVIKKALDMDDEELDSILATMNLSVFQLLEPSQLQNFMLTATETEPIDLLTNSTLIDVFQNMSQGMEQLTEQYGMNTEDIKAMLTEVSQMQEVSDPILKDDSIANEETTAASIENDLETAETVTSEQDNTETTQKSESKDTFTVKEESTGIDVTVKTTQNRGNSGKEGMADHSQQGIAGEIVNQLSQAVGELDEISATFSSDVQQAEIIQQIVEQIKVFSGNDVNQLEVQLYPQHLGKVQIQVAMKSGVLTAQITTETEMAKTAIEGQLVQLKEAFEQQNLKVDAVEVSVATSGFQSEQDRQNSAGNQENDKTGRKIHLNGFGIVEDERSEEELEAEMLEVQGASVEFTA